jgi:hypothetical protein
MLSGTVPSSPASFEGKKTIVDGLGVAATLTQEWQGSDVNWRITMVSK